MALSLTACSKQTNQEATTVSSNEVTATLPQTTSEPETTSTEPATETEPETTTEAETTTEPETTTEAVEPVEISLIAVGDMLLHGGIHNSALQADGSYDYTHVFEHTKAKIEAADIAVANQEVILGGVELQVSSYPNFNSPQDFGTALVDAGFDVVLHASNHTMDKDSIAIENTINFWKNTYPDITYLGINESVEDQNTVRIVEKDGIKIAMLNYTYGLNGIPLPTGKEYIVNLLDEEQIAKDMAQARELADFIIVYPHWGTEYNLGITDSQKDWAQFFADNGADLIIGTHPHVVEPVEWITAADGSETLVYYSLGNFISIQYYNYSMLGGMAEVTICKDENGTYISDYDMDFLVTHYTAGRTEMTTYMLEDYTDELAARHAILVEPYQTAYAEGYTNVNQWYPFTVEGLNNLAKQVCPQFFE